VVNPQEITVTFFSDSPRPITCRTSDNLPPHVKGVAKWNNKGIFSPGYYIPQEFTPTNAREPVEFINNSWYTLIVQGNKILCKGSEAIPRENTIGLGYWKITDPQHPNYQAPIKVDIPSRPASRSTFRAPIESDSESSTASAKSFQTIHEPNSPVHSDPAPTIDAIVASIDSTISLSGTLPLDPPDMSASATTVSLNPPTNGIKGVAPAIFDGKRSRAENFLNNFRQFKLLNRKNESFSIPFYRVLTALSYIRRPLIEDWVNAQDKMLEKLVDPSSPTPISETDEVLWDDFEKHFKSAWQDTAKVQSAYEKLIRLTMQGYDIDTYNATFARLASAAKWEPDAKGTVDRYCQGLRANVHRKILEHKKWPTDMEGWMEVARKEVNRAKEIENAGLNRFRSNQISRDPNTYQTGQRSNNTPRTNNNQHIPMDVDAANTILPFKKLTDEERAQYRAEG
jgi:hypothetical protein